MLHRWYLCFLPMNVRISVRPAWLAYDMSVCEFLSLPTSVGLSGSDVMAVHPTSDVASLQLYTLYTIWRFPQMMVLHNGWSTMERTIKMEDDWGYPYFRKPQHTVMQYIQYVPYIHLEISINPI